MYDHILIRYGELALKGKNQKTFLNQLVKNIKELIKSETGEEPLIETEQGRIFLKLNGQSPEKYYEPLKKAFGVLSFSPVRKTELDMEAMQKTALEEMLALDKKPATFRVTVRRPNKRFPVKSPQAQKNIGAFLLRNYSGLKVDLHSPDVEVFVEIRYDAAYVYTRKINGPGGLPLGTGGKAMLLLSGGLDSPVAGWLTMKRGVVIEAVHFYSYPYTSERAKEKVLDLARVLAQFAGEIKVHIVPFTRIQESISEKCYDSLWITLMRRFMFRIAERIAEKRNALALVTGENIGQVASQTIESIYAINRVIHTPVLRPLITMDKEEIMNIARNINTYDISIRPYEDCCTVFLPKEPKTKPKLEACEKAEELLRVEELVQDAVQNTEVITIKGKAEDQFGYF
ncbi:MAG: tRNA 4-thiouridine(8) synthase ThiI [Clostridia bacterium]|nr:tRNA 4-thiouridine(8) synthase ThiI [Clostridia bacterium]